jgi:hypothetical protein
MLVKDESELQINNKPKILKPFDPNKLKIGFTKEVVSYIKGTHKITAILTYDSEVISKSVIEV